LAFLYFASYYLEKLTDGKRANCRCRTPSENLKQIGESCVRAKKALVRLKVETLAREFHTKSLFNCLKQIIAIAPGNAKITFKLRIRIYTLIPPQNATFTDKFSELRELQIFHSKPFAEEN